MSDPMARIVTAQAEPDVTDEWHIETFAATRKSNPLVTAVWQANIAKSGVVATTRSAALKRLLDIVIGLVALILLLLLFPVIYLAIRLDSKGPCLFRQIRVGKDGRPFIMYKFRSMHTSYQVADQVYRGIASGWISGVPLTPPAPEPSPDAGAAQSTGQSSHQNKRSSTHTYKLRNDPRITRVGRVLRATSLDELPQIFNVLLGNMSIIGPRPGLPFEVNRYRPRDFGRLVVKPGLTGLWQVKARGRATFQQMIDLDIEYVEESSFWYDVRLLLLTIPAVLCRSGAG